MNNSDNDLSDASDDDSIPIHNTSFLRRIGDRDEHPLDSPEKDHDLNHPHEDEDELLKNTTIDDAQSDGDDDAYLSNRGLDDDEETKTRRRRNGEDPDIEIPVRDEADQEIDNIVKAVTKNKSVQYQELKLDYEKEAEKLIQKMSDARQKDQEIYSRHTPGEFPMNKMRLLPEVKKASENPKLLKTLVLKQFLNICAQWVGPYDTKSEDEQITYPNVGLRLDIVKILDKIKMKNDYFEDQNANDIVKVLQRMDVPKGNELEKAIKKLLTKWERIVLEADKTNPDEKTLLHYEELQELQRSTNDEIPIIDRKKLIIDRKVAKDRRTNIPQNQFNIPDRFVNKNFSIKKKHHNYTNPKGPDLNRFLSKK